MHLEHLTTCIKKKVKMSVCFVVYFSLQLFFCVFILFCVQWFFKVLTKIEWLEYMLTTNLFCFLFLLVISCNASYLHMLGDSINFTNRSVCRSFGVLLHLWTRSLKPLWLPVIWSIASSDATQWLNCIVGNLDGRYWKAVHWSSTALP